MSTSDHSLWRRMNTVAVLLLSLAVGAVALAAAPNFLGRGECDGGDCPDIVLRDGTEYILAFDCDAVPPELRRSPRDGVLRPAVYGASETQVATFAVAGLPEDEVIAVEGPKNLVCPTGAVPGSGVAYSSATSARTTARRVEQLTQR